MGNNAASNINSMRGSDLSAPSQQAAQFERLLKDGREICLDRLSKCLASMLDKVPAAFWNVADDAREREVRDPYSEGKVNADVQRKRIEAEFRTNYVAEFAARAGRQNKGATSGQSDLAALERGAVNDEDLEETLHVNDMAAKLRRDCEEELAGLDQLLGGLAGDTSLQGESNPFNPQAICHAFQLTCRALEPNRKLRLVLLNLFHDHVLDDIRSIYKDLSTALAERSSPTYIGCGTPLGSPQEGSLVASLTRIQRADPGALASGNLALAATLTTPGTTNVVRELRGTSLASGLGPIDSAMLDMVALLFDQIFACDKIPPLMKGLIGQLQIPILKVAILDSSFLCKKTHPARKLLDCLGDIAVSLVDDLDEGSPLYDQIQKTVRELADGFQYSLDIFDRLHQELEAFVAWQNRPAEEQVELVARRVEYKERLALAKAIAQQEVLQRAKSGSIPRMVLRFLTDHWVKVMLIAHAKHGGQSEAWNKAVATMDLLIWSVRPKHSPADRRMLAAVLPRLLRRLNTGTRGIGTEDDDRKRFFVKLMRCHVHALNSGSIKPVGSADPAWPAIPVLTAPTPLSAESLAALAGLSGQALGSFRDGACPSKPHAAAVMAEDDDTEPAAGPLEFHALTIRNPFGEGDIAIEEISLSDLSAGGKAALAAGVAGARTGGDEYSRIVGTLREGAWVEFRDERNNKRRARLFYISPLRRTYLFVNRQSANVGEYSVSQLARELRAGRASVIETTPLFDQAMAGLIGGRGTSATLH